MEKRDMGRSMTKAGEGLFLNVEALLIAKRFDEACQFMELKICNLLSAKDRAQLHHLLAAEGVKLSNDVTSKLNMHLPLLKT